MRLCILATIISIITAGLLSLAACGWNWELLKLKFELRSGLQSYWMQERNFLTMSMDVADLLFDQPTFDRLRARAYVARALYSCENVGLALTEEADDFSAAIKLDPKYARAYAYRGCALSHIASCLRTPPLPNSERDDYQRQMVADLKKAIELDPHGSSTEMAYSLLFHTYEYQFQQHQRAIEVCSLAISNLPASEIRELIGAFTCRAEAFGKLGQHVQEKADYEAAKKLSADVASE